MNVLPVEYHYEFYTSKYGDPFAAYKTSNALAPISAGDALAWQGFPDFPLTVAEGSEVRIAKIEHIIWEIQNDHIGHKLMVYIEIVPVSD